MNNFNEELLLPVMVMAISQPNNLQCRNGNLKNPFDTAQMNINTKKEEIEENWIQMKKMPTLAQQ
ncbi:hypothetical protein DERP_009436 [Dermatophagoides pteronyssinus]|uniref:Uncharacterized protein n=1 Tax=Dermatophagoides pteronyssinus TaxID=6956 RepID=A0ABQ8IU50_DERPT|nr:hypothetical protein DERP_009436 [Dermatophagoides pteronyssinus]